MALSNPGVNREPGAIRLKRVYLAAEPGDGQRILVERLWPRGLTREAAALDGWMKDIAPSPELRRWYGHDQAKWAEFRRRYETELDANAPGLAPLRAALADGPVTLVYATRDEQHSSALVLRDYLRNRPGPGR